MISFNSNFLYSCSYLRNRRDRGSPRDRSPQQQPVPVIHRFIKEKYTVEQQQQQHWFLFALDSTTTMIKIKEKLEKKIKKMMGIFVNRTLFNVVACSLCFSFSSSFFWCVCLCACVSLSLKHSLFFLSTLYVLLSFIIVEKEKLCCSSCVLYQV